MMLPKSNHSMPSGRKNPAVRSRAPSARLRLQPPSAPPPLPPPSAPSPPPLPPPLPPRPRRHHHRPAATTTVTATTATLSLHLGRSLRAGAIRRRRAPCGPFQLAHQARHRGPLASDQQLGRTTGAPRPSPLAPRPSPSPLPARSRPISPCCQAALRPYPCLLAMLRDTTRRVFADCNGLRGGRRAATTPPPPRRLRPCARIRRQHRP